MAAERVGHPCLPTVPAALWAAAQSLATYEQASEATYAVLHDFIGDVEEAGGDVYADEDEEGYMARYTVTRWRSPGSVGYSMRHAEAYATLRAEGAKATISAGSAKRGERGCSGPSALGERVHMAWRYHTAALGPLAEAREAFEAALRAHAEDLKVAARATLKGSVDRG